MHRYSLFRTDALNSVKILIVSESYQPESDELKEMIGFFRRERLGPLAYSALNQCGFENLFRRMNPKAVIPADEASTRYFMRYVFFSYGPVHYAVLKGAFFLLVSDINMKTISLLRKVSRSKKYITTRRIMFVKSFNRDRTFAPENPLPYKRDELSDILG
ncbi:MAG: hypothetical protein ACP5LX_06640 [Nitrososphaeria archaeon]